VGRIAPSIFLLVETDLWPALLQSMKRRQIPMVLVNGRISLRRVAFRSLFQPVFRLLNHICVQTEVDAERLIKIGVSPSKISVTGNLKFAQALGQLDAPPLAEKRYQLPAGAVLLIAGSTHPGEEEHLLDCYRRLQERQRAVFLMIAPRHPERLAAIEALIRHRGYTIQRWSQFQTWQQGRITLVDSVGNLPRLYSLAHFVFVGGSFVQRGGHNILEPAAWGKPIFFGPYMENYSSIAEMTVRAGAAIRVGNGADLAEQVEYLINDPGRAAAMGLRASALVRGNQGVVDRDLQIIERVLSQSGALPRLDSMPAVAVRRALMMLLLVQPLWQ
jgi:3-deoxy-D-manno-octulosonic-acid transferase